MDADWAFGYGQRMAVILGLCAAGAVAVGCLAWRILVRRAAFRMRSAAQQELARDGVEAVLARIDAELDAGYRKFSAWQGVGVEHVVVGYEAEKLARRQKYLVRYREIVLEE